MVCRPPMDELEDACARWGWDGAAIEYSVDVATIMRWLGERNDSGVLEINPLSYWMCMSEMRAQSGLCRDTIQRRCAGHLIADGMRWERRRAWPSEDRKQGQRYWYRALDPTGWSPFMPPHLLAKRFGGKGAVVCQSWSRQRACGKRLYRGRLFDRTDNPVVGPSRYLYRVGVWKDEVAL